MGVLVTKKLISADCACAGELASTDIAATATHAGVMIRETLCIVILPIVFIGTPSSTRRGRHYSGSASSQNKSAAERTAAPRICASAGDQLVCWIAESSQFPPRCRA